MGARNRGGIGLLYRPAAGIHSLESILGHHEHLKVRALTAIGQKKAYSHSLIFSGSYTCT
jgi:hypothetical protein